MDGVVKLRPSTLLLRFAPLSPSSARLLLWTAGVCVLFLLGFAFGARRAEGIATEREVRAKHAHDSTVAVIAWERAKAEQQRETAELALDSARIASRKSAGSVVSGSARIPRIADVKPDSTGDMVTVCYDNPPGCYPAHKVVAQVAAELDSLVHQVVIAQLIPQFEAERAASDRVINAQKMELTLARQMIAAQAGRIADLERAHRLQHTLTRWQRIKRTGTDLAVIAPCTGLGIITGNVGLGMGCGFVVGAVLR